MQKTAKNDVALKAKADQNYVSLMLRAGLAMFDANLSCCMRGHIQPITYLAPALLLSSVTLANATSLVPLAEKLTAGAGAGGYTFGYAVTNFGSTDTVGAHFDDDAFSNSGSAYLHTASAPAPVPLPASLWLLGAAVGGAAGLRRVAQRRRT